MQGQSWEVGRPTWQGCHSTAQHAGWGVTAAIARVQIVSKTCHHCLLLPLLLLVS